MRIIVFFSLVFLFPSNLNANNLFAQFEEVGEHYDPFADYSEFEEASEEEADVHFFKNGRPLAIGGFLGPRIFTGSFRSVEQGFSLGGGGFLNFFFSLRNSVQLGFFRSKHRIENQATNITGLQKQTLIENTTLSEIFMDVKHYFNTQNVTKGLATINPYLLVGISRFTRLQQINWKDAEEEHPKNPAWSVNTGLGVEFPFARNKSYFGIEVKFQLVSFVDENEDRTVSYCYANPCDNLTEEEQAARDPIVIQPRFDQSGDLLTGKVFVGFNF